MIGQDTGVSDCAAAASRETFWNVLTQFTSSSLDQGAGAIDLPLRRISSWPSGYSTIEKVRVESISARKMVFQTAGAERSTVGARLIHQHFQSRSSGEVCRRSLRR